MTCLDCNNDISDLVNFDTLCYEFIECPKCKLKMVINYDETWDEETNEEDSYWWLEKYIN